MSDEPFQWAGGRKFLLSVLAMMLCAALPVVAPLVASWARVTPEAGAIATAIGAIGAIALAYNGANTAVSWAWSKQATATETIPAQYTRDDERA